MKKTGALLLALLLAAVCLAGCAAQSTGTGKSVANPVSEKKSVAEVSAATGFDMAELEEDTGFAAEDFAAISGKIGQIGYRKKGGAALTLRMAEGHEDISGVGGVEYEQRMISDVTVNLGDYGSMHVAWFTDGGYTYSLTAEEYDGAAFETLVAQFVAALKTKK